MEESLTVKNFDHLYLNATPLKENIIYELKMMVLNNPTVNELVEFYGYGIVDFDNHMHDSWNIELFDEYKKKVNVIVFKVKEHEHYNPHNYKYVVMFNNNTKSESSFNYFWCNDDKVLSRISLDTVSDVIIRSMVRDINIFKKTKLYNGIMNSSSNIEYECIYKEYIEIYRAFSYKEYTKNINTNLRWATY